MLLVISLRRAVTVCARLSFGDEDADGRCRLG